MGKTEIHYVKEQATNRWKRPKPTLGETYEIQRVSSSEVRVFFRENEWAEDFHMNTNNLQFLFIHQGMQSHSYYLGYRPPSGDGHWHALN
ncbi:hypothetical protein AB205_0059560 [Aquarana catesbeiana]|uniref:Uncharacterized protein n=1 Tax=Aquarana catesbeiana TaxID=8400 RepID=A0A2G9QFG1_AQUCT|nr:hypothetical protein AB205_0059560 [Aquarana catesbeiana]